MEHQNTTWKSVHNAFQMGMVGLAATWHQNFFIIPYKGKSPKSFRNALAKSFRNSCEKVAYDKFQVYSLQV